MGFLKKKNKQEKDAEYNRGFNAGKLSVHEQYADRQHEIQKAASEVSIKRESRPLMLKTKTGKTSDSRRGSYGKR